MTPAEFQVHLKKCTDELFAMTATKGVEYADEVDQLSSFKDEGKDLGLRPEQVLMVYLSKHFRSIKHAVRAGKTLSEPLHSRCIDAALYLILLSALHSESEAIKDAALDQRVQDFTDVDFPTLYPVSETPPLVSR